MRIDVIFENARARTLDPSRPTVSRIGVLHGRLVGFDEELDGVTADRIVDVGGAPVLPGFHDAHFHGTLTGSRLASLDLRPVVVRSLDALYDAVRKAAAALPEGAVIRGAGYDQNITGGHPTAEALDAVSGGRPVALDHVSGHMSVINTAMFALAGFPGRIGVPDVPGGHVDRDTDGVAVGLLQENAQELFRYLVSPDSAVEARRNLMLVSDHAVKYGLTSLSEPGGPNPFTVYQDAIEHGFAPRMVVMPFVERLHEIEVLRGEQGWFGLDEGIRTGLGDDRLKLGPTKIVSDGSLIGRSAAMHHCYHGEPDNSGFMRFDPDDLTRKVVGAHRAGWTVATHAIGDAALDHALDAIEQAQRIHPRPGVRHRIEHFALASDAQVARAAALGVVPVPQGRFISEFGDGMAAALGPERAAQCYRMRSLLEAGMVLPGSTDSPVADGDPLRSIHDMVNRRTASGAVFGESERVTIEQAVTAYTYGSAYAVGEERSRGTLRRGSLADLVVLSDDLFSVPSESIRDVRVGATVIGGDIVFDDGALA